jgi:Asp-tRNA(Asn)/Glu-tRNA(Gln) amidotransferase A subunit family amidase
MLNRRHLLKAITATGIGTALFHRSAAAAISASDELSVDSIKQAEWITGLELTDEQREEILQTVRRSGESLAELREFPLTADVPMAIQFAPTSQFRQLETIQRDARPTESLVVPLPNTEEEIAFLPVHQLSWLIRTQKLSSVDLTNIYLRRLKKYAPMLRSVVVLTEELALEQAKRADEEISQCRYRGPLHGIPWGAKDLIAIKGYPTSWGIPYLKDRELENTATVADRLEAAGAVLVAKLSLGALAQGDQWFGGMTRCPWNPKIGSSGSSAGSASSVVAGLVGFTLGSETLGSILSPSIRNGASALRPTFGRVSREGCMPLCWSLDKIGPICRSIEDCALVFDAIHGADGKDLTAGNYPFQWPSTQNTSSLKVGYSKSRRQPDEEREDLKILREMGCELVELTLPTDIPVRPLISIIDIEAASVFDELLRAGHTEGWNTWDEDFRAAQYVSAVDYVRVQRTRTLLMRRFEEAIAGVDVLVNMNDLVYTNLTGHPSVVMPIGYRDRDGVSLPRPIVLTGHLNDDERLLSIANQFQSRLTAHREHPPMDAWLEKFEAGTLDEKTEE